MKAADLVTSATKGKRKEEEKEEGEVMGDQ